MIRVPKGAVSDGHMNKNQLEDKKSNPFQGKLQTRQLLQPAIVDPY